jgi:hypothetical protein
MARIRSIHPALFTDEAFVSVSMAARVLLVGIWTEADDQGVFDWKPVTLKMRLMPVDNIDVSALLTELGQAGMIKKFEQDGKALGAIRNFCKFQKPKTPKYRPLKSDEIRKYVASSYQSSEIAEAEVESFLQNGEMSPQMEEGGGNREEKRGEAKSLSPAEPRASASEGEEAFEEFQTAFPKRDGPHAWDPARKKFLALVKTGVDPQIMIGAAKQFAAEEGKRGNIGTRFIPAPAKWLAERRFGEYAALPDDTKGEDWESIISMYARTKHWSRHAGPDPDSPACRAPPQLLEKYGIRADSLDVQHRAIQ